MQEGLIDTDLVGAIVEFGDQKIRGFVRAVTLNNSGNVYLLIQEIEGGRIHDVVAMKCRVVD